MYVPRIQQYLSGSGRRPVDYRHVRRHGRRLRDWAACPSARAAEAIVLPKWSRWWPAGARQPCCSADTPIYRYWPAGEAPPRPWTSVPPPPPGLPPLFTDPSQQADLPVHFSLCADDDLHEDSPLADPPPFADPSQQADLQPLLADPLQQAEDPHDDLLLATLADCFADLHEHLTPSFPPKDTSDRNFSAPAQNLEDAEMQSSDEEYPSVRALRWRRLGGLWNAFVRNQAWRPQPRYPKTPPGNLNAYPFAPSGLAYLLTITTCKLPEYLPSVEAAETLPPVGGDENPAWRPRPRHSIPATIDDMPVAVPRTKKPSRPKSKQYRASVRRRKEERGRTAKAASSCQ